MDSEEVNELITSEVDGISDSKLKGFIKEILKIERGNMGKDNFEYKEDYKNLIKQYMESGDS
ncbi:hypothetical protein [Haloquadratum walsbyi]|jgi:hypothetical protein|uniref:Uncharacterized protein n=1 Tax=Haloquadratum walsbyi (strain DSM 16854 / JCM 12705 / C23) TaxID=768065 RepID=G0LHA5_HALWC|nr:hypothetical protein [Haloquadratum walsbyi]CCC40139.1 uncharacterized protein Hqrw_2254 [Haloquadratum walsbyi C23]